MSRIKDSGNRRQFETDAVRDMSEGKGRFDLLPMCVLIRLAKHYENGAKKYDERNWEKGIPAHSFLDSALRHIVKYADGWSDEDHLISAIWNLCGLAWTEEKRPEMLDLPFQKINDKLMESAKELTGVPYGTTINCIEMTCYYNTGGVCECDNADSNPFEGKDCKWFSED